MLKLEVSHFIQAGHQLPDSIDLVTKACHNYHGHTYGIQVSMYSEKANRHGMVVDFKGIKMLLDNYDHTYIFTAGNKAHMAVAKAMQKDNPNQRFIWLPNEPTAENIAQSMLNVLQMAYPDVEDITVRLCEGYKGVDNTSWVIAHDE